MAELESMVEQSPVLAAPPPAPPYVPPYAPSPAPQPAPAAAPVKPHAPVQVPPDSGSRPSSLVGAAHDEAFGLDPALRQNQKQKPKPSSSRGAPRGKGGLAVLALGLVLAAGAYAGWTYRDDITALFGPAAIDTPVAVEEPAAVAPELTPEAQDEAAAPATTTEPAAGDEAALDPAKFTQRLNPDGTETDAGPAPGPEVDNTVEGRSVAELTDAGPADEAAAEEGTAELPVASEDATAPAAQPLGVAQKMILYEERLGQQSLEVKPGTVVWTLVDEQSGDGPAEKVIRGEINNPDKGLSALITIKRNTDASLPASHIVEIVFALPPDFEGGSIDQLQRIAMKQTEADQGNPLVAVPAKITQDFYMVALNDLEEARKFNTDLMRQRNWIDIPVVYANGRQALITLEKGASGTEVFNQALDAWARAAPLQ